MTTAPRTYSPWRQRHVAAIARRALVEGLILADAAFEMDLEAADCHIGIRLRHLLKANDFDFAHDVLGIVKNLNRTTARIDNLFLPRYAASIRPRNLPNYPSWFTPKFEAAETTP